MPFYLFYSNPGLVIRGPMGPHGAQFPGNWAPSSF